VKSAVWGRMRTPFLVVCGAIVGLRSIAYGTVFRQQVGEGEREETGPAAEVGPVDGLYGECAEGGMIEEGDGLGERHVSNTKVRDIFVRLCPAPRSRSPAYC
jgi:hypothetical protein